jgi:hypothetical protein
MPPNFEKEICNVFSYMQANKQVRRNGDIEDPLNIFSEIIERKIKVYCHNGW